MLKKITAYFLCLLLSSPASLMTSNIAHASNDQISQICAAIEAADKGSFSALACSEGSASCAANKDCANCVSTNVVDSQVRKYCASINAKNAATAGAETSVKLYIPATVACTTACVASKTGIGAVTMVACTGLSIGAAVGDIMNTINTHKQMSKDVKGWMVGSSVATAGAGVAAAAQLGTAMTAGQNLLKGTLKEATKTAASKSSESCVAMGFLMVQLALKLVAKDKIKSSISTERDMVGKLNSDLDSKFNACVAKTKPPECRATFASGMGNAGGASGYIDRLKQDPIIAGSPEAPLLEAIGNPAIGGNINLDDITRRILGGESPASVMGSAAGLPNSMVSELQDFENRIKNGERLEFNGSTGKESIATSGGASMGAHAALMGSNEIGFGSEGVNPMGTTEEIGIDRAPAQATISMEDGDIFHSGFPGTIFQIISKKLADSHGYVEKLEPVLPLNRALSGYKNESPKKK